MAPYARALIDAADAAVARWVRRCVSDTCVRAWGTVPPEVAEAADAAAGRARSEVVAGLTDLLAADIDAQRTTPLEVVRAAVRHPTEVLAAAGVPPAERDPYAQRAFPADVYDLSPTSWRDVDEALHQPGLEWGAAKAYEHLRRRQGSP